MTGRFVKRMVAAFVMLFAMRALMAEGLVVHAPLRIPPTLPCTTRIELTHPVRFGFERTRNGIFFLATVKGQPIWFVLDSGAGRTLIDSATARRIGVRGKEKSAIGGAGNGRVPGTISKNGSVRVGEMRLDDIDLNLLDLSMLTPEWGRKVEGVVGYDLLCRSIVTVDYERKIVTIAPAASVVTISPNADVLPLTFRNRWSFVEGTIKVPGNEPITDQFLVDSGSQDAVDHPIIKKSTGPLRHIQTGNGIGEASQGVLGPTEWFRIGRFTIGSTQSSCCGNEQTSRLIGAEALSHFRVTFDYPRARLIISEASPSKNR